MGWITEQEERGGRGSNDGVEPAMGRVAGGFFCQDAATHPTLRRGHVQEPGLDAYEARQCMTELTRSQAPPEAARAVLERQLAAGEGHGDEHF